MENRDSVLKTILVTGACGGIGSKLVPLLLDLGYRIIAVDNLYSGSWENLESHENLTEITLDVSDSVEVKELFLNFEFSYCIHLAAISSLPECQINPVRSFEVNFLGTQIVAELCAQQGRFEQFIFASTSAVYEGVEAQVFTEELSISPLLVYPQSKYFSEHFLNAMFHTRGFPVVNLRFFNVFGDRQNITRKSPPLINYLVRELFSNRPPILFGWNAPGRDYISVDTVISIIARLLGNKSSLGKTYNVCTGKTLEVKEIYSIVANTMNSTILPVLEPPGKLWSTYPELTRGTFPLKPKFVQAETNKFSLGSTNAISDLIGEEINQDLAAEISKTVIAISNYLKLQGS